MHELKPRLDPEDYPDYKQMGYGGDPYLYPKTELGHKSALRNKYGFKDLQALATLERLLTAPKLKKLNASTVQTPNSLEGLQAIHHYIFQDIYHWAGRLRKVDMSKPEPALGGASVAYSKADDIAEDARAGFNKLNARDWNSLDLISKAEAFSQDLGEIWRTHPFREGNTRTTLVFAQKFAREKKMPLDMMLLRDNADYVRVGLVAATEGQPEHLEKIIKDAVRRGEVEESRPVVKLVFESDQLVIILLPLAPAISPAPLNISARLF